MNIRKCGQHRAHDVDPVCMQALRLTRELCAIGVRKNFSWHQETPVVGLLTDGNAVNLLVDQQGDLKCSVHTRTIPTATHTSAFAIANPTMMLTAGRGNFLRPGIHPWQATARLFMPSFKWTRAILVS